MIKLQQPRYLLIAASLFAGACQSPGNHSNPAATADSLHHLASRYYAENMALNPLQATQNGENQYNDQLPIDISESYRAKADSFFASYQQAIKGIDTSLLSGNDRITYDMLRREFDINREGLTFHDYLMPVQQFTCLPLTLTQLAGGTSAQPFKTEKDYRNFMHRMERFAIWTDTAIANMRRGMASGYVLPKSLVVKVIPQVTDLAKKDPANNVYYAPLKMIPDSLGTEVKSQLIKDYTATIEKYILPSFAKLQAFLQNEYLPQARSSSGISGIPDGKAYYAYLVKTWTTTDLTPEAIFNLGEKEVARIRGEMETVKNSTGFQGDLPAFFASVRTDKKLRIFKTPAAILDSFKAIENKIMPSVKKMYGHLPKTPFEIRQTEAYRAASASAEYMQGSADGTRPGVFYVPILDATQFSYTGIAGVEDAHDGRRHC